MIGQTLAFTTRILLALFWCPVLAQAQMLYWTESGEGAPNQTMPTIRRIEATGVPVQELLTADREIRTIRFDPVGMKIYWVEPNSTSGSTLGSAIRRANADGSQIEDVITFPGQWPKPRGIDIDPVGKIYWSEDAPMGASKIMRSNIDGTNVEAVVMNLTVRPGPVTIDAVFSKIYWADLAGNVMRANFDGSEVELFSSDAWQAGDLNIDVNAGHVFWSSGRRIYRRNRDGSGHVVLLDNAYVGYECERVRGLDVEPSLDAIYWVCDGYDNYVDRVWRARLDGSGITNAVAQQPDTFALWGITLAPTIGKFFWTGYSSSSFGVIQSADLHLGGVETLLDLDTEEPRGIVVDPEGGKMYWIDHVFIPLYPFTSTYRIQRADLDGSHEETLLSQVGTHFYDLALDIGAQKVYWTNFTARTIERADLDGSNPEKIHDFDDTIPLGLALDPSAGKMYWTSSEPGSERAIRQSNLDGTEIIDLLSNPNLFGYPRQLALDLINGAMYWTVAAGSGQLLDSVYVADLSGGNAHSVQFSPAETHFTSVVDLCIDATNGKLFLTRIDGYDHYSHLYRTNLDGTSAEAIFTGGLQFPFGVALNPSPHITASDPPDRAIDARQPHEVNDPTIHFGWNSIAFTFSTVVQNLASENFMITETGGDGQAPDVASIVHESEDRVRINLSREIDPGAWTCVKHIQSGTKACVGYLPGDVNGDGTTTPVDILALIDAINGVTPRPDYATDVNRDGTTAPADILREIDLLNGADAFEPWLGRSLP